MTDESKQKRKALHRGISDLLPNPDADRTSKLLGKVAPSTAPAGTESVAPPATLAQQATVAQPATVAQISPEPLHNATVAQQTTVAHSAINEYESTVTPNDIWDEIIPTLDVYDQSVLWQLYRLTRGYHRDTCIIGLPKLATRCNIGKRQVSTSIERLEKRELIERLGADFSNKDKALRGNIYRINLPEGKLARRATVAHQARDAQPATVAPGATMKTTTQKEITQTQARGVSRFSLDECRAYADHLHKTGAGINSPRAFAASIYKTGNSDADIETFLNPPSQTDISQCPDCRGTGFIYIDTSNHDKGVRPCKHEPLKQVIE